MREEDKKKRKKKEKTEIYSNKEGNACLALHDWKSRSSLHQAVSITPNLHFNQLHPCRDKLSVFPDVREMTSVEFKGRSPLQVLKYNPHVEAALIFE